MNGEENVVLIGHRGALAVEPENTMRSYRRAMAAGVDVVELDLHLTSDGEVVAMHDATVDRTTNGTGRVSDLTLAEVRQLDAGGGERVPTFTEILGEVDCELQVEVKELPALTRTRDLLEATGRADDVTITSNRPVVLEELRDTAPDLRRGLILPTLPDDPMREVERVGAGLLCVQLAELTPALRERCADAEVAVNVWIVNDDEALERALAHDVENVSTDDPDLVAGLLGREAAA